jgi:hypothetical protein
MPCKEDTTFFVVLQMLLILHQVESNHGISKRWRCIHNSTIYYSVLNMITHREEMSWKYFVVRLIHCITLGMATGVAHRISD